MAAPSTLIIQIIREAIKHKASIAIEDLTGIRERLNAQPRSKTERRRSNSWAFYQLRLFLEYKSIREGVKLLAVPPAYTSQTCHKCLSIHPIKGKSYRNGKRFVCGHCGNKCDADLNGARMIRLWGCIVNQPRGSVGLACQLPPGLLKAHPRHQSMPGASECVGSLRVTSISSYRDRISRWDRVNYHL